MFDVSFGRAGIISSDTVPSWGRTSTVSRYLPTTDPVSEPMFTQGKAWKWLIWNDWAGISLPVSFTSLPDVTPDREATGGNWQRDTEKADKE